MPDHLGLDYDVTELPLRGDGVATLVSLPCEGGRGAVLYIHGFVDYFFHDHVARHFAANGWAWYAIDLRRCGRSLRDGDEPWYTSDLTEYYEEIDLAIQRIHGDGHTRIVLMGHSTGGLISSIWANDRRDAHPIDALILNSPWLDVYEPWYMRTIGTWIGRGISVVAPMMNFPRSLSDVYPQSVHSSANGEWHFNPQWKPLTSVPVKMGFVAAVRRQHARLHRGIDVGVPVLMIRSSVSHHNLPAWTEQAQTGDTVLDVQQMQQWLPSVGRNVTDVPIEGAMHDVLLSAGPVRERALTEIDAWLTSTLPD